MAKLFVEGIECYAHHGCLKEEAVIGQRYMVNVVFDADLKEAITSDNLTNTFDYVLVKDIVLREMKQPSKLIEHAAGRILKSLLHKFNRADDIIVTVIKFNPPVNGYVERAAIEISKKDVM
jgi:7,8-dihydroneopterin aldolase/epimerase/oxygenase